MRDFFFPFFFPLSVSLSLSLSLSARQPPRRKRDLFLPRSRYPSPSFVIYREFPFSPSRISRVFVREFCILLLLLFFGIGGKHSREGTGVNHVAFLLRVVLQLHRGKSFLFRGGRSQRPVLHKFSTVFPRFFYRVVAAYLFFSPPRFTSFLLSQHYTRLYELSVFSIATVCGTHGFFSFPS